MIVIDFPTNGGGSGGGHISRPKEIYVTTDGSDVTGQVGHLSKPFATVGAAIAAGEATYLNYVIILGIGAFSVTTLAPSSLRSGFVGQGYLTALTINNAGSGQAVIERIHHLIVTVYTNGTNAASDSEAPTNGAAITLEGQGWIQELYSSGGSAWNPSGYVGGVGDSITLYGQFATVAGGYISSLDGTDGSGSPPSTGGAFIADGCDLRLATIITTGTIYFGRCSYTTTNIVENGVAGNVTNNMGGNAVW